MDPEDRGNSGQESLASATLSASTIELSKDR
jgi:hypothetical protein